MDKQNNSACKTLEVIWTRNSNNQGLQLLPEMKEINIDDTVVKVKKSFKTNENAKVLECANRRVKRSLFQEKKKKKVHNVSNTNKLNKIHFEHYNDITSLRKTSDDLIGSCQITREKSPQIVSNREKLEKNKDTLFHNLEQRLFPTESSKPIELSMSHRNIIHNNYVTSPKKETDSLSEVSQILRPKSPQILSNREILERNQNKSLYNSKHCLFQTESLKAVELSTLHKNNELKLLPEINEIDIDDGSSKVKKLSTYDYSLHTIKINENSDGCEQKLEKRGLFHEENKKHTINKSNKRHGEFRNHIINVKKTSNALSKTSKISRSRSPQIISNREKFERNQNTSFHKLEQHFIPTESSKTVKLSLLHNNRIHNNCITSQRKISDSLSEVSQMSCSKSPQILSNREKLEKNLNISLNNSVHCLLSTENVKAVELSTLHINNSTRGLQLLPEMSIDSNVKVKKSSKSDYSLRDIKVSENNVECSEKRVKRSLFQVNKNNSATNKSKKRQREPCSYVINVRKRFHDLSEVSKISCLKSPKVVSNREKLEINQDISLHNLEQRLFPIESVKTVDLSMSCSDSDTSIIKSLCISDQINPLCTRDFCGSKSPEIMSNRKRTIEYKNLNKIDVFNYDKIDMIDICRTPALNKLKEKSGNVNTLDKVQSKINTVDSEDIIESSETIIPPKKHKSKKNKVRHSKKNKIKNDIDESKILHKDEFKKSTEKTKTNKTNTNVLCDEINYDSLDIINTENILKSPVIELKIKNIRKKPKLETIENQNRQELFKIDDDIQKHRINTMSPSSSGFKKIVEETTKGDLNMFKLHKVENTQNTDKKISFTHSEVSVILATPEHCTQIADKQQSYIPLIEVDQSPKTQHIKHVLIQSIQSPSNAIILPPTVFESLPSPTQSINDNSELPFKVCTLSFILI